ncbi:S28 family serine protease [Streptomyces sp. DSM 44915]|uniref:S28 family serine protease n=1 Tax=Streptomyces chisholmiae TaxID=3075540 RepID=A0ABU2JXZ7_9ACTN|nr:S28 family serine protease [Streptomyces sp. DSM 44915]MDT0269078.1 S28 family serine protease [Streptomyces sp. DSM 44915]
MRKTTGWLVSVAVLAGTATVGGAATGVAQAQEQDIAERIAAIPGMTLIEEKPAANGDRFLLLSFEQPVDHRRPGSGTFEQRISVLHTGEDRPTVFHTNGYWLNPNPAYSEPTQLLDANEVGLEHRFFGESVPEVEDWTHLDIYQAASDQHRVHEALSAIYDENWISHGRSKGGMTAAYYRYYYPEDMDGTVAYVAPSSTDREDTAPYDAFLSSVGTEECRSALEDVERELLLRRDEMVPLHEAWAEEVGATFTNVGGVEQSFEVGPLNLRWTFWQYYGSAEDCAAVPEPTASTQELYDYVDQMVGWGADHELAATVPYYYQAATQLGNPLYSTGHIDDLLEYPELKYSGAFVPPEIELPAFDNRAMTWVDGWVTHLGTEMLFVDGEADPWSAKPFTADSADRETYRLVAPGANHSAGISLLGAADRDLAVESVRAWAGLPAEAQSRAAAGNAYDPALDHPEPRELLHP